nr:uncharacterized protein LOC111512121 [Leptinotarsa decemlineata]
MDKNCNQKENEAKETDLLKDLQKIHNSITELGKMKKNKQKNNKKPQKPQKEAENADILHHTELTMKVKVFVNPSKQTSTKLTGASPDFNDADKSLEKDIPKLEDSSVGEIVSGNTDDLEESYDSYTFSSNHRQLTILKCDSCDYNTRSFQKIEQHVLIHLNRLKEHTKLVCPHCSKSFENILQMYQHSKSKHFRCNYQLYHWCVNCSRIFSNEKAISEHFNSCPRKNYVCKLFRSNRNMFCMLCNYESDNEKEAKAHRNSCQFKKLTVVGDTIEID